MTDRPPKPRLGSVSLYGSCGELTFFCFLTIQDDEELRVRGQRVLLFQHTAMVFDSPSDLTSYLLRVSEGHGFEIDVGS